ncbi:MAG: crossover junction endodeoxyribonuclease RuvC [Pseudomonadota bacterium]
MVTSRILGIDPGSRITGYGIVDYAGDKPSLIEAGVIRAAEGDFNDRLALIYRSVKALIERLQPDQLSVEQVFVSRNAGTALKLGAARSAAICASFSHNIAIAEYTPREIKLAVTGSGSASKEQVQHMMRLLLSVTDKLQADAADALAVAVCHANSSRLQRRLAAAGRSA